MRQKKAVGDRSTVRGSENGSFVARVCVFSTSQGVSKNLGIKESQLKKCPKLKAPLLSQRSQSQTLTVAGPTPISGVK